MTDALGADPPAKEAAREELRRKRKIVSDLMQLTEAQLRDALRLLGVEEGSPEWEAALRAWREKHSGRF